MNARSLVDTIVVSVIAAIVSYYVTRALDERRTIQIR